MVLHHCIRHVETAPARPSRAQTEIGVFTVEEEVFVERADLLQHGAPVEGRRAAGEENFFRHWKKMRRTAVAALLAAAIAADQHAGGIQRVFAVESDLRGAHARVRARFHGRDQSCQPARNGRRVVVECSQIAAVRLAQGLVNGGAEAYIARLLDYARIRGHRPVKAHCARAAVIYDNHLKIVLCLLLQCGDAFLKPRIGGQRGYHHGYEEFGQT